MKQRDRLRAVAPLLVEAMEAVEKDRAAVDFVERLRAGGADPGGLRAKAADEIERLRAEVERLNDVLDDVSAVLDDVVALVSGGRMGRGHP